MFKKIDFDRAFQYLGFLLFLSCICVIIYEVDKYNTKEEYCQNLEHTEISYPLVTLNGKTFKSTKGKITGSFFLIMGSMNGNIETNQNYILRYMYKDKYGAKIETQTVTNNSNIRIKEIDGNQAKMIILKKYYSNGTGQEACTETEIMKIFEVPKGTIYKEYNVNLNN